MNRVINGGGSVVREMGTGKGRLDLCVEYNNNLYPIELKIFYDNEIINKGKEQLLGYMDRLGCNKGWLILFDRSKNKTWDEKIYQEEQIIKNKHIVLMGC